MSFSPLGLPAYLLDTLEKQKFTKAYPIQEMAIPAVLEGKDLLGIAQTGSGKTASYVLPILANLEKVTTRVARHVEVLVLVPTRELAVQVEGVFKLYGKSLPFRFKSLAVYGGASINVQMQALPKVNVLVATPGRLLDLISVNAVQLSAVKTLVLDEADKMLNLGFKDEMDKILTFLPEKRQNLLFSATLSPNVENVRNVLLEDPLVINIAPEEKTVDLINQSAYSVTLAQKGPLLRHLIKAKKMRQVLVFTSSVYQADQVASKLSKNRFSSAAIHGKKSQGARSQALSDFKTGKVRVLVATDLLARGIDIEFLPFVINYELPRSPKDFVHRIGRTGRAENPGEAISFVTEEDRHHFKVIQKKMKKWVDLVDGEETTRLLEG
ncbi:DEAD/DEAH box helicase [Lewinella cohaerens]|uniref:DEAD/DEAH box helicase n=1 Tax=Lewinella cohaerens TaxID=70995 RepID=UPI00036D7ADA|nr:DEAD/DEAH box helicase [Lewinella cohaerens]